jgi:hypothetical protein
MSYQFNGNNGANSGSAPPLVEAYVIDDREAAYVPSAASSTSFYSNNNASHHSLPVQTSSQQINRSGSFPSPSSSSSTLRDPTIIPVNQTDINATAAREYLTSQKWPTGLQDTFINNLQKIPIRFFICDDSGSMNTDDGHRLIHTSSGHSKLVSCTRWSELTSALTFHATIAKVANAPTQFRLLNAFQPITLGSQNLEESSRNYNQLLDLLAQSPSGRTPLCIHIREVIRQIEGMASELRARNQKACVVIASDGESTDGDVAAALRPLERLPAWVVIRLCTDEEKTVNYWNNIDNDLELEMDVLDDLEGEAKEIHEVNSWLTYGEPLHRLREFGIPVKEIDLLDEHPLNLDQIRLFASLL